MSWSLDILLALEAKGKDGFITGTVMKPKSTKPEYGLWKKSDQDLNHKLHGS